MYSSLNFRSNYRPEQTEANNLHIHHITVSVLYKHTPSYEQPADYS